MAPRNRQKKKDVGHHAVANVQVAKGDRDLAWDVYDDVPEQADTPHERDARQEDPTLQQEVSIPEYWDVPSHILAVFDQTDVIDAVGDLGSRVRPPEGDHEALVPMVRVDETSLVLIPPLQRHNIELREQVTELREQVTELRGQVTEL